MLFDMRLCCSSLETRDQFRNLLIPGTAEPVAPGSPMGIVSPEKKLVLDFDFW